MDNKTLGLLITAFVLVIIGASLIGVVAEQGNNVTETLNILNESVPLTLLTHGGSLDAAMQNHTLAEAPATGYEWKRSECPITNIVIKNASGTIMTLNTHYEATTLETQLGIIGYINGTAWNSTNNIGNISLASYTYCPDQYLTQSWSRSVLDLVPGFFAFAIMAIGVALLYGIMRKEGILNI